MLNNDSILNKMQRLVHKHLKEVPLLHLKACLCLIKTLSMFANMKRVRLAVHFNSTMKMFFFFLWQPKASPDKLEERWKVAHTVNAVISCTRY